MTTASSGPIGRTWLHAWREIGLPASPQAFHRRDRTQESTGLTPYLHCRPPGHLGSLAPVSQAHATSIATPSNRSPSDWKDYSGSKFSDPLRRTEWPRFTSRSISVAHIGRWDTWEHQHHLRQRRHRFDGIDPIVGTRSVRHGSHDHLGKNARYIGGPLHGHPWTG